MEIFLGALTTIFGVIVGGVLQHFTSRRAIDRQHQWERSRLVHEKLENIAQTANEMGEGMKRLYSDAIISVESGERYNPQKPLPFAKLELLLSFYAPELRPEYDQLLALRDEMGSTIATLINGGVPKTKAEKQHINKKLLKASFQSVRICDKIIGGASKLGRTRLYLNDE